MRDLTECDLFSTSKMSVSERTLQTVWFMPFILLFPETEHCRTHDVPKVTWKSHNSSLSLLVLVQCFDSFWNVGWSLGTAGHRRDGDGLWESSVFTPPLLISPASFFRLIRMIQTLGSLVWQPRMVEVGIPLAWQEDRPWLQLAAFSGGGCLPCPRSPLLCRFLWVRSLLHFPYVPSTHTSRPTCPCSCSPAPQAHCAFKFCLWKPGLRLDPTPIFHSWGYISPRVPSLKDLRSSFHL